MNTRAYTLVNTFRKNVIHCVSNTYTNPFVAVVALKSLLPWSDDLQTSVAYVMSLHKRYVHDECRLFKRISGFYSRTFVLNRFAMHPVFARRVGLSNQCAVTCFL